MERKQRNKRRGQNCLTRCVENSEIVWRFAKALSAGPRPYFVRGDNLVVFCFATPEDADAFCGRFDGERLPVTPR
jgi:hypothetical protein